MSEGDNEQVTEIGTRQSYDLPRTDFLNYEFDNFNSAVQDVKVTRFDFVLKEEKECLQEQLKGIYGHEGSESERSMHVYDGSSEYITETIYASDTFEHSEFDDFKMMETRVRESGRIIDIVTIGYLSEEQMERHDENKAKQQQLIEENDRIMSSPKDMETPLDWQEMIDKIGEVIPSFVNEYETKSVTTNRAQVVLPTFISFHVGNDFNLETDDGEIDQEDYREWLKTHDNLLRSLRFSTLNRGYQALLANRYITNLQSMGRPWGRLSVLDRHTPISDDELSRKPLEDLIDVLLPFHRAFYWANYRKSQIEEIDTRMHNIGSTTGFNTSDNTDDLERLLKIQEGLEELRQEWVSLFVKTSNELHDIRHFLNRRVNQHRRDEVDLDTRDDTVSFLDRYQEEVSSNISDIENNISRIKENHKSINSLINDQIEVETSRTNLDLQKEVAAATEASLGLQKRINRYTILLTALTILLFLDAISFLEPTISFIQSLLKGILAEI